ncbi:uncharacterized protein LOC114801244 [Denticeps clupeoides]|uniref:Si:dkey-197j19.6 n=1 Tax=Denticeps clupeoides TaxID=299321 RepID=A0AAY4C1D6_9TELE|nr:uncharacterized protein LOC114801244 [Denticeps clupeoides]
MFKSGSQSALLSTRENGILVSLLGPQCTAQAAAVIQLLLATASPESQCSHWEVHSCGVVCLVLDSSHRSAYFRLYCLKKSKMLWEQELYTPFTYSAPCRFFHSFAGDEGNIGLNFADEEEADRFFSAVQKYIKTFPVQPQLIRSHTLDCGSSKHLREKLEACQIKFPLDSRPRPALSPKVVGVKSVTLPPQTLPKPKKSSLPLAIRKGPLPTLPGQQDSKALSANALSKSTSLRPINGRDAFAMVKRHRSFTEMDCSGTD